MHFKLAIQPGDGIVTEVKTEADAFLRTVATRSDLEFAMSEALIGCPSNEHTG